MPRSPFLPKFSDLPETLSIFPLTGAVLMPGVQLPLNIFEPRYLNMVADALAETHLIGMIQPTSAAGNHENPDIHKVGCCGRITSYSETSDGRIVLVLTGVCRFEVEAELSMKQGFRRVKPAWERFAGDFEEEDCGAAERASFLQSLKAYTRQRDVDIPWDDIEKMPNRDLVNLLCVHLPLEPEDKQALIEAMSLHDRTQLMQGLMDMSAVSSVQTAERRH